MNKYNIAVLEGDGVGIPIADDITALLKKIADKHRFIADVKRYSIGKNALDKTGKALPEETVEGIKSSDSALLFALQTSGLQGGSPIGTLRRELNLFADVRIIKSMEGRWSLKNDIDIVFIRESTQGFLSDRNMFAGSGEFMPNDKTAISMRVVTEEASEKIARFAFEYASKNNRKSITLLHKESIFQYTCGLFLKVCEKVGKEYPHISLRKQLVDDAANMLIANPLCYDVILTTNMFGDILSDEASALVSNLVPSCNLSDNCKVYLPINHQAQYDKVESRDYDELPSLLCLKWMLSDVGEAKAAKELDGHIKSMLNIKESKKIIQCIYDII